MNSLLELQTLSDLAQKPQSIGDPRIIISIHFATNPKMGQVVQTYDYDTKSPVDLFQHSLMHLLLKYSFIIKSG